MIALSRRRTGGLLGLTLFLLGCGAPKVAPPPAAGAYSSPPSARASPPASAAASQQQEISLPVAREEAATAGLGEHLYLIAGFDAARNDSNQVFVSDGRRWWGGPQFPVALDHPAAAVAQGRLYIAGGFRGGVATTGIYRLSIDGTSWETLAPLRHPRGAAALVGVGSLLYVLGGRGLDGEVAIAEVFDTRSEVWSELQPMPQPRDHLAGFARKSLACVAGGRSPQTPRVDCYDPGPRTWTRLPDLAEPTIGAGAATLGGVTVVAGGEDGAETRVSDTVRRLQEVGWVTEPMLLPRHGFQLAPFQGRLWACGGGAAPGLHPVATCTSIAHQLPGTP